MDESYWQRYTKPDPKNPQNMIRDGEAFEELVKELLCAMYGKPWQGTKKSWDGNRDFYLEDDNTRYWAECKNHKGTVKMNVLAPTLVMAEAYDADTILFFSYSRINGNARKHIGKYAEQVDKLVYYYDDEELEALVRMHNHKLSRKHRISIKKPPSKGDMRIECYAANRPSAGAAVEDDSFVRIEQFNQIAYNSPFSVMLLFSNPVSAHEKKISISMPSVHDGIRVLSPEGANTSGNVVFHKSVSPGQTLTVTINLIADVYEEHLLLPRISITEAGVGNVPKTVMVLQQGVACNWDGRRVRLLGQRYQDLLSKIETTFKGEWGFTSFAIGGSSGTGKTRMLEEAVAKCLEHGYRVISMSCSGEYSSKTLIKEIIAFLFELPGPDAFEQLLVAEQKLGDEDVFPRSKGLMLYGEIDHNETEADLERWASGESCHAIFKLLASQRIALVIDNVQYSARGFKRFIGEYAHYAHNSQSGSSAALICVFNTDFMRDEDFLLWHNMESLSAHRHITYELRGFEDENQALLFLREIIHVEDEAFDNVFKKMIHMVSANPYWLHQAISLLKDTGALKISSNGRGFIVQNAKALEALRELESAKDHVVGGQGVLDRRIEFLLDGTDNTSNSNVYRAFSALFLHEPLDSNVIRLLNIDELTLRNLVNRHFATETDGAYRFEHDLIRNYFFSRHRKRVFDCWSKGTDPSQYSTRKALHNLWDISINGNRKSVKRLLLNKDEIPANPPGNLARLYYEEQLMQFLPIIGELSEDEIDAAVDTVRHVCQEIKRLGRYDSTKVHYEKAREAIEESVPDIYSNHVLSYRLFLDAYVEVQVEGRDKDIIQRVCQDILKRAKTGEEMLRSNSASSQDVRATNIQESLTLQAYIHNRIYVAYNHIKPSQRVKRIRKKEMDASRAIAGQITNPQLKRLIEYLNDSDEGYNVYGYYKNRDKLLEIWSRCVSGMPEAAPEKTLNYYRKLTQLDLLNGSVVSCRQHVEEGREYLRNGHFSYEPVVFECSFLLAEAVSFLIENPSAFHLEIEQCLEKLREVQAMIKGRRFFDIHLIEGVLAFVDNDCERVYRCYREAWQELDRFPSSRHWIKRDLLRENIQYSFSAMHLLGKARKLDFLGRESVKPLTEEQCKAHRASGVLRTRDNRLNLPLV